MSEERPDRPIPLGDRIDIEMEEICANWQPKGSAKELLKEVNRNEMMLHLKTVPGNLN